MLRLGLALAIIVLRPAGAWAQAENIAKGVDAGVHAATNIADQGGLLGSVAIVVGVLSVILHVGELWAIVSLFKALQALQDKRADDAKDATKEVASTSIAGTNAIAASNERLTDHSARVQTLAERVLPIPEGIGRIEASLRGLSDDIQLLLRTRGVA